MKKITNTELDNRLVKADPAKGKRAPKLTKALLEKATRSTDLNLIERFALIGGKVKAGITGGVITVGAAALAVALVVNLNTQPLIQLASGPVGGNREGTSAALDGGSDAKIGLPYLIYEYVAGPNLSTERGSGMVYKLIRQQDPETVLTNVAAVMGVSGEIREFPDFNEQFPGYFLSESEDPWGYDQVNPTVSIWWSGTANWYYSNPAAYPQPECLETDSDGNCISWPEFKPTPELLPSRDEAIAKALEIFNATGLEATEADLRYQQDDWGVSISSALKVAGEETNIEWYVGWSSIGVISYAGGHSVVAQEVGSYETISAVEAIDRLDDWRWYGAPASSYYYQYQPYAMSEPSLRDNTATESPDSATDSGEGSDTSGGTTGSEPGESGSGETPSEDQPIEEPFEPEVLELVVTEAKSALVSIWDANGDVWLVPGYIMINEQGWFNSIIALIEGVIELPKLDEVGVEPLPAEDTTTTDQG